MNIAMRNVPVVRLVPPVWKITAADWWWWKSASTNANTTMPRISNNTPVLLMIATSLTPKMFKTVISASGSVTHTDVTVRIPAKEVDPAGEPRVGLPGQVLRPLEDRPRDG